MEGSMGSSEAMLNAEVVLLSRVPVYDGSEEKFPNYQFQMLNFAGRINPVCAEHMNLAVQCVDELAMNKLSESAQAISRQVYFWLSMTTSGSALDIVKDALDGSALEAWRQLTLKSAVKSSRQKLGMLRQLMDFDFGSLDSFESRCRTFEQLTKQYEAQTGETVSQNTRMAALLGTAPEEVRKLLQLNAQSYSCYADMKTAVLDFARNSKEWRALQSSTLPSTDLFAMNWRGHGRGRGSSTQFGPSCTICGKHGHRGRDCWNAKPEARTWRDPRTGQLWQMVDESGPQQAVGLLNSEGMTFASRPADAGVPVNAGATASAKAVFPASVNGAGSPTSAGGPAGVVSSSPSLPGQLQQQRARNMLVQLQADKIV